MIGAEDATLGCWMSAVTRWKRGVASCVCEVVLLELESSLGRFRGEGSKFDVLGRCPDCSAVVGAKNLAAQCDGWGTCAGESEGK